MNDQLRRRLTQLAGVLVLLTTGAALIFLPSSCSSATIVLPDSATAEPPPVAVGFPTRATAGVPVGWLPTQTLAGDFTVSIAGAVVEDIRIVNGSLIVNAPNVTVRRVEIVGGGIRNSPGSVCNSGLVISDTTVTRGTDETTIASNAIETGGYTAERVKIDALPEGFRVGDKDGCGPVSIRDSFVSVSSPDVCGDWHGDGVQGFDGGLLTVRNTTVEMIERDGCGGTAPFFYPGGQGNSAVDVDGLLVKGGGYPFRLGTAGTVRNLNIVADSWSYGPIDVDCTVVSVWDARIVTVGADGQPVFVRDQPCDTRAQ